MTYFTDWMARLDDRLIHRDGDARRADMRCPHCAEQSDVLRVVPVTSERYGLLCPRCQRVRNALVPIWVREYFRLIMQPFLPCGCRNLDSHVEIGR